MLHKKYTLSGCRKETFNKCSTIKEYTLNRCKTETLNKCTMTGFLEEEKNVANRGLHI